MTVYSSPLSRPQGALVSDFIESLDTADGTIVGLSNMELRLAHGQQSIPEMGTPLTCKAGHWGTLRFSCRRTGKDPEWFPERNCKTYCTGYSCPGVLWAAPCNCVVDCKWIQAVIKSTAWYWQPSSLPQFSPTSGLLPQRGLSLNSYHTSLHALLSVRSPKYDCSLCTEASSPAFPRLWQTRGRKLTKHLLLLSGPLCKSSTFHLLFHILKHRLSI